MPKVGFIGAGNVACSMGRYFSEGGIPISGYHSPSKESVDYAATFTGSTAYFSKKELVEKSDIVFIATPDDAILSVWESIKEQNIDGKIIAMFSGSLSSDLFSGIEKTGASGASVHPMFAFSDKNSDYQKLNTVRLTLEGDDRAVQAIKQIFERLGNVVTVIDKSSKKAYHAAAAIASNLMIGLYDLSLNVLCECGFEREGAIELVKPLVKNNVTAMLDTGCVNALSGPVERADIEVVKSHLNTLSGDDREIYRLLSKRLVEISQEKYPDRDYEEFRELLENK